jgi:mannose-6-phosphate isomerase-like protein (cupin superfamily)
MANPDINELTRKNKNFRKVLSTNQHSQVVLMSIEPGDDIGEETHEVDQILVFVEGEGQSVLDGKRAAVKAGSMVQVPAGTKHNFINKGEEPLKLYTIYAPPEEEEGLVHKTKADAEADEAEKE